MSEYIPETSVVRVSYGRTGHDSYIESNRWAKEAEFDRWLAAHDREVAAKAWDEGYEAGSEDQAECEGHRYEPTEEMLSRGFNHWAENPYKNGETL